jgi:hypothetical protein
VAFPASSVVALLLDYLIHRTNKNYILSLCLSLCNQGVSTLHLHTPFTKAHGDCWTTVASDQRKQHSTRCAIDELPCPLDGVHVPTSCCSKRAWSIFIKLHIQGEPILKLVSHKQASVTVVRGFHSRHARTPGIPRSDNTTITKQI